MQCTPAFLFASAPGTRADASRHRYKAIDAMQRNMAALLFCSVTARFYFYRTDKNTDGACVYRTFTYTEKQF